MHRQPSTVKLYIRHNRYGERHRRADSQSELRKQSVHDGTTRQDTCGFWRRAITFDMLNPGSDNKIKTQSCGACRPEHKRCTKRMTIYPYGCQSLSESVHCSIALHCLDAQLSAPSCSTAERKICRVVNTQVRSLWRGELKGAGQPARYPRSSP